MGALNACYWHESWFFLFSVNGLCTFFSLFWQKIDKRDCYLAGKPFCCSLNSFWRVFIFVSTSRLERFTLKVAFSPSGALLSLNASVWFREWHLWIGSVATGKFHVQKSCCLRLSKFEDPVMFVSQWKSVFFVGYFKLIRMKAYLCIWKKVTSSCGRRLGICIYSRGKWCCRLFIVRAGNWDSCRPQVIFHLSV